MGTEEKKPIRRTARRIRIYLYRYEGKTYAEISRMDGIGYSAGHLENVLGPSGKWYQDYMLWANEMADVSEKEARLRVRKRLEQALTVLEIALTKHDSDLRTAVKAANSILDRGGLKAPEKILFENPYDQAERLAQWIENKNKPKPKLTDG